MGIPILSVADLSNYLHEALPATDPAAIVAVNIASEVVQDYLDLDQATGPTFTASASTDELTIADHRFRNGEKVKATTTGTLPAPLVAGTFYWVRDAKTNTLKLAAMPGEDAIDITSGGSGVHTIRSAEWPEPTAWSDAVRGIALQIAGRIYVQGPVKSETTGSVSTTFATDAGASLTPAEERTLHRHRRVGVA